MDQKQAMELARQLVATGWEVTIDVHPEGPGVYAVVNATAPSTTISLLSDLVALANDRTRNHDLLVEFPRGQLNVKFS